MSYYRTQLEDWLAELDVKAERVIDWGGIQNPVGGRTKTWEVEDYQVWDLPAEDIQIPLENKEVAHTDIVFCLEVFEYLIEPVIALKNIQKLLKPNGKTYVTFAFCYPHHEELELEGLRYTEPSIHRLAEAAGLKVTNGWYRRDKSGLLEKFYRADGMHPSKNYPHHNVTGFICELAKESK